MSVAFGFGESCRVRGSDAVLLFGIIPKKGSFIRSLVNKSIPMSVKTNATLNIGNET